MTETELKETIALIAPPDEVARAAAHAHWAKLAKPLGGLGRLETMIEDAAALTGREDIDVSRRAVFVLCADNGVVAQGVSQTDQSVTRAVAENLAAGRTSVCRMAAAARCDVVPVDIGMAGEKVEGVLDRRIADGTADFTQGPAMTREQALECLQVGIDMAREEKNKGLDIVAAGEMGIGNTTPSSAIVAVLTGTPVETVTGRGSGVRGEVIRKKIKLIEQGIALNKPDPSDTIDVLAKVGGPEIGAMAGLMLGAASLRVPIVIDGFIAGAAAAIAQGIRPEAAQYFIGSHNSAEPGHKLIMDHIGVTMYMDLGLCLGEGTGAALFFPLLDAATRVLSEMKTLPELDITVPR